ncbi:MAG: helix-turn-helix domain-containing protein [Pseudomonadota bacterium]
MTLLDLTRKDYFIASKNDILLNALSDNTDCVFTNYHSVNSIEKADILIIDTKDNLDISSLFRANIVINLTKEKILKREIEIQKPFFLQDIINIISKNAKDTSLFCVINNSWIYNERASALLSKNSEIVLTNKENDLFKTLLISNEFTTDKESLQQNVWGHHRDTESTTIETHIYKLKQKLPKGLLEIKNSNYFLNLN